MNIDELREEYFHLHVEIQNGLAKHTTAPHDLFEWFRANFETEKEFQKTELERVKEELTQAEKELEAYKKHIFISASDKTGSNI